MYNHKHEYSEVHVRPFDVVLVNVGTWLGFLRWAILILMTIGTFYLINKEKRIKKINLGIVALIITVFLTPILLLDVVIKKDDDIAVVPDTSDTTPIPSGVPDQGGKSGGSSDGGVKPTVPTNSGTNDDSSKTEPSSDTPSESIYREIDIDGALVDGSEKDSKYEVGKTVKITANEKEGYHFAKWFSNNSAIKDKTDNPLEFTMPDDDILIYPVYEKNQYIFTLEHYDYVEEGDISGSYDYEASITVTAKDRTAAGFVFTKWVNGNNETVSSSAAYTFTMPANDLTLYPVYENVVRHTVTFVSEDSTYETATVDHGAKVTAPANNPEKEHYHFVNWVTEKGGDTAFDFANTEITADTNIYAKFDIDTYTVTFVSEDSTYETATVDHGAKVSAPANNPEKEHYHFVNWVTEKGGDTAFDFENTTITSDTSIYAKFDIDTYTVTFVSEDSTYETATVDHGAKVTAPANNPEKEHYHFVNWVTEKGGDTAFDFANTEITADTNIYAKFDIDTYTVTFVLDNGEQNPTETVDYNGTVTRPQTDPTKTDYTFDNWYVAADGNTIFDFTTQITSDTSIYAHWTPSTEPAALVCQLATELHVNQCNSSSGTGCLADGYAAGSDITYGNDFSNLTSTPNFGDAYDCDINNDGDFDVENERFYYVSQNGNNAALMYYIAVTGDGGVAPRTTDKNINTYSFYYNTATTKLPTSAQWTNPALVKFDSNYVGRLLTKEELEDEDGCGGTTSTYLKECDFVYENSAYDGFGRTGVWLYNTTLTDDKGYRIQTSSRKVDTGKENVVRPVIEVPDDLVEKYTNKTVYIHFNTQGGSAVADKPVQNFTPIGSLPAAPTRTDYIFEGWHTDPENYSPVDTSMLLRDDITFYAHWSPDIYYNVSFDYQDGTSPVVYSLKIGDALGTLPTKTRTEYKLFGWYTDTSYYTEVTPETTVPGEITYYARWISDTSSFPIVFSEVNACTFNGSSLSGDYCTADKTKGYIDTGIKLFSNIDNSYAKDFEIGFDIVTYNPSDQTENQATLVSSKAENITNSPGFVFRRYSGSTKIEYTERYSFDSNYMPQANIESSELHRVRIRRISGVMYYAWNDEEFVQKRDISANTTYFEVPVWFGASVKSGWTEQNPTSQRLLRGTLTDMYIKLGTYSESSEYTVSFDGNGGTPETAEIKVNSGDTINSLPNATRANHTFDGWYTATDDSGNLVGHNSDSYTPDASTTLYAHWTYNSSDTPVSFNIMNDAVNNYVSNITLWNGITDFSQAATKGNINTVGSYGNSLKQNYVNHDCIEYEQNENNYYGAFYSDSSYHGSVHCDVPAGYDTGMAASVNVYFADDNNGTLSKGNPVSYTYQNNGIIYNMMPDETYYWEDATDSTKYGYISTIGNTRYLYTEDMHNIRDLGGLRISDGSRTGTIKYGKLFRGAQISGSSDAQILQNAGVTKEIDLCKSGCGSHITNTDRYGIENYKIDIQNYSSAQAEIRDAAIKMMEDVVNDHENLYFHCRVGSDRTGTIAYILEGLLGVTAEERYKDYELTHFYLSDRNRYYMRKNSSNDDQRFVYMVYDQNLMTNQQIYDYFMHGSTDQQADDDLIQAFRTAMIDYD